MVMLSALSFFGRLSTRWSDLPCRRVMGARACADVGGESRRSPHWHGTVLFSPRGKRKGAGRRATGLRLERPRSPSSGSVAAQVLGRPRHSVLPCAAPFALTGTPRHTPSATRARLKSVMCSSLAPLSCDLHTHRPTMGHVGRILRISGFAEHTQPQRGGRSSKQS